MIVTRRISNKDDDDELQKNITTSIEEAVYFEPLCIQIRLNP